MKEVVAHPLLKRISLDTESLNKDLPVEKISSEGKVLVKVLAA